MRGLDFTSALYLGFAHRRDELKCWGELTLGKPAALQAPPGSWILASRLASLQGSEFGVLGASTLHLFWDLFGLFDPDRTDIHIDHGSYPIASWGALRGRARGLGVMRFPHHDPDSLWRRLRSGRRRPVVVADGFCPDCGRPAPLAEYLVSLRARNGILVIDDTQALGILGSDPTNHSPYGRDGGGTLRSLGLEGAADIIIVSSLAKAFGAPLAGLSGAGTLIRRFAAMSETAVHCSPPSLAAIEAGRRALKLNQQCGRALRHRLARRVGRFRERVLAQGLALSAGMFPVQTLTLPRDVDARVVHERLAALGVRSVLRRSLAHDLQLSFLLTARHTIRDIDFATAALARSVGQDIKDRFERGVVRALGA